MRILKRGLRLLLVVALVAVIAATGFLVWVTVRAMPETTGTIQATGLVNPVTVARDAAGIAHITADTPHDLFFAQGYVHASERMWQMEVWRHIAAGRLAETFGAGQIDTDKFIRTLGWRVAAQRDLDAVAAPARAVLDAYTAGVNAWLDGHRGSLGLAFLVAGVTPEPWTDLDTIAWGKVQAWNLGGNFDTEVFRYLADERLGDPARTDALFPPYRDGAPIITPTGLPGSGGAGNPRAKPPAGATAAVRPGTAAIDRRGATPALAPGQAAAWHAVAGLGQGLLRTAGLDAADGLASDHGIGSNDWVVGPAMSASGGALLANDPHLGISMPSIWYLNGLHCRTVSAACPYDVAGVSFPGVPGVVLGHNARIAWGATNIDPDVQDLVIEKVDPADPGAYLHDGASVPFTVRHEQIKVSGGTPVDLEIRSTVHGPSSTGSTSASPTRRRWPSAGRPTSGRTGPSKPSSAWIRRRPSPTSARRSRCTARRPRTSSMPMSTGISATSSPATCRSARRRRTAAIDLSVATTAAASGPVGCRSTTCPGSSTRSMVWWSPPTTPRWTTDTRFYVAQEWDPGYRAERILDLIAQAGADGLTVAEMGQIQFDGSPLAARDVAQFLEGAPTTADGALISTRIADWDGVCDEASVGCAAFNAWQYRVLRDIFDDDLGPLARDYVGSPFSWVLLQQLLDDPTSAWWDDTATTGVTETADDIIGRAMDEAGAELRGAVGAPEGWTWGRLHMATFREATLGTSGIGPLEWYFNDGPHPVQGTAGAIDNTYFRFASAYPDPDDTTIVPVGIDHVFDMTNMPSYRLTIDMGDLDGATGGHHHRPVGQPVRPPLRRPGRAVAARPDRAVGVHPGRHRWGDRLDADPDALSATDRSGARRAGEVLLESRRERRADRHIREDRGRVGRRRDPFDEEAVDDDRGQVAGDDRAGQLVSDRRVRERHHRIPVEHVADGIRARLAVEPAEDQVRPDREVQAVGLERDPLLLVAARPRRDHREQVAPLDGDAVDGGLVAVLEALAFDVVDQVALLAVQEVGQPLAEHGHLAGDRAVGGEPDEFDRLHGRATLARDHGLPIRDIRTKAGGPHSFTSSGPSGTSMRIRPPSTTTA